MGLGKDVALINHFDKRPRMGFENTRVANHALWLCEGKMAMGETVSLLSLDFFCAWRQKKTMYNGSPRWCYCDSCGCEEQLHWLDREGDSVEYFGYWCLSCRTNYEISNLLTNLMNS